MLDLRCIDPACQGQHAFIVLSIALCVRESKYAPQRRRRVRQLGIERATTLPRLLWCRRRGIQAAVFVTNDAHTGEYRKFQHPQCTTRSKVNCPGARIGSTSTGITSFGPNLPSSSNLDSGFSMRC